MAQVFFLIQIHPQLDLINQKAYLHFPAVHSVIMMITEYTAENEGRSESFMYKKKSREQLKYYVSLE